MENYINAVRALWKELWPSFSETFGDSFATEGFFSDLEVFLFDTMVRRDRPFVGRIDSKMSRPLGIVEGLEVTVSTEYLDSVAIAPENEGSWRSLSHPEKLAGVSLKFCQFFDWNQPRLCEFVLAREPQLFPEQWLKIPTEGCSFRFLTALRDQAC